MPTQTRWLHVFLALCCLVVSLSAVPFVQAGGLRQGGGPVVIVNTPNLNQRTGPGPQYAIQGVHPGGAVLPVVGRTQDRSWWEVDTQYGVGWVSNEFVLTQGDFRNVPVVTEYGVIERPVAIVLGLPIPVYALPNPGSRVLGYAPREARFPIFGRTHHTGTDTWYWLVQTSEGMAWVEQETTALYGFAENIATIPLDLAYSMETAPASPDGVINPPPPTPVPSAPLAAPAPTEAPPPPETTTDAETGEADTTSTAGEAVPVVAAPPQPPRMRLAGDCYALPLVSYLVQLSPVRASALHCSNSAAGRDAVILGQADLALVLEGGCGTAVEVPVATLYAVDGSTRSLSFCIASTPNATTQTFTNWVASTAGQAAIHRYRGLPGLNIPQSAAPAGG